MVGLWWIWNLYLVNKVPKNLFSKYVRKGIRHGIREGIRNSLKAISSSHGHGGGSSSSYGGSQVHDHASGVHRIHNPEPKVEGRELPGAEADSAVAAASTVPSLVVVPPPNSEPSDEWWLEIDRIAEMLNNDIMNDDQLWKELSRR